MVADKLLTFVVLRAEVRPGVILKSRRHVEEVEWEVANGDGSGSVLYIRTARESKKRVRA